jgi:hypothetical protein
MLYFLLLPTDYDAPVPEQTHEDLAIVHYAPQDGA